MGVIKNYILCREDEKRNLRGVMLTAAKERTLIKTLQEELVFPWRPLWPTDGERRWCGRRSQQASLPADRRHQLRQKRPLFMLQLYVTSDFLEGLKIIS